MWVKGKPELGKSFFSRFFCETRSLRYFNKPLNKWWCGYHGEEIVILEDIDHETAPFLYNKMKQWVDEAPFIGETKGGAIKIRPRGFIVTSNYTVKKALAERQRASKAIRRRFDIG